MKLSAKKIGYIKLYPALFLGFFLCALGWNLLLYANLGADPWVTFQKALSDLSGLSYGRVSQLLGIIIILSSIPLKIYPGIGTILNMFFIGFFMDIIDNSNLLFTPSAFIGKLAFLFLGMILLAIGIWMYLKNGLGAGPRDGLMLGLVKKLNLSVTIIKTSIEVTVLMTGLLLGGPLGIGTVIAALGNGFVLNKVFEITKYDSKNTVQRTFIDEWESFKHLKEQRLQEGQKH